MGNYEVLQMRFVVEYFIYVYLLDIDYYNFYSLWRCFIVTTQFLCNRICLLLYLDELILSF